MPDKFLCYDLRVGIVRYGLFQLGFSGFYFAYCLYMSMACQDSDEATRYTFHTGAALLNVGIKGSMTYGAYKESRTFLLPFLIVECLGVGILTILCVCFMFYMPILIFFLLILSFFWYVWLCVLTLYQTLDPRNPHYIPKSEPSGATMVCVDPPPLYYENENVDAV